MAVLTITTAQLKRLCALPAGDTDPDDALAALIASEQPVHEYALDPAVLTASLGDTGLLATLTLGVAERMAGSYLEQTSRARGATDDFQIGGLHVTASRTDGLATLGGRLAAQGLARLAPFARAGRRLALDAVGDLPDGSTKAVGMVSGPVTASIFDGPGEA